jgi:hypothetical protein
MLCVLPKLFVRYLSISISPSLPLSLLFPALLYSFLVMHTEHRDNKEREDKTSATAMILMP